MIYFDDFGNELKLCRPIQVSKNRRMNPRVSNVYRVHTFASIKKTKNDFLVRNQFEKEEELIIAEKI
jgi:hypothetical protein